MVEGDILGSKKALQGADLVYRDSSELLRGELHFTAAEALEVGEARVGADSDVVLLAEADGVHHYEGIAGGKALVVNSQRGQEVGKRALGAYEAWKPQAMLAWSIKGSSSSSGPQAQLP